MTRIQVFLLGCLLLGILGPAAYTQFRDRGGRGGGGGGPPGGGRGGFNPDDIFNRYANGASTFDVNKIELQQRGPETVEQQREKMNSFLQTKGVSNGQMTKELYREYFEGRMRDRSKMMAEMGFKALAKEGASFDVEKVEISGMMLMGGSADRQREQMKAFLKSKGVGGTTMTKDLYIEFTENRIKDFREKGDTRTPEEKKKDEESRTRDSFNTMDTNKDGGLTKEEAQAGRQSRAFGASISEGDNFEKYDTNKNGKIEFDEFQKYLTARTEERARRDEKGDDKKGEDGAPKTEENQRPTVYRFGKLPQGLPEWFGTIDGDQDGQVGLYEWKKEGRSVEEFLALDSNGDGFLTVEEMLRNAKVPKPADTKNGLAMGGGGRMPFGGGMGGGAMGGFPGAAPAPAAAVGGNAGLKAPERGRGGRDRFGKDGWGGGKGDRMKFGGKRGRP